MPSDSSLKAFLSSLSPEDVATLFAGLRNTLPIGMGVYSPELNAGEAEVIAKRQAERDAARAREMEILTRLLPQAMAKRQAAIPESGADPFVPTRPRIMRESPFMFTQPRATPVPQQYATGGGVLADQTTPDMSDGGQMLTSPQPFAGGGSVLKGALGLAEKPAKSGVTKTIVKEVGAPSVVVPGTVSLLKDYLRRAEGDYSARRLERAADEIPNLERMYRSDALNRAFTGQNAEALMTMNPANFEKFAQPLPSVAEIPHDYRGFGNKYYDEAFKNMTLTQYIDHLAGVKGGFDLVPFLDIEKMAESPLPHIRSHEGRHRSRVFAKQGEPASLVTLHSSGSLGARLPRTSREEYIEALRKELGSRMVTPQKDWDEQGRELVRPLQQLPEPYAQGGPVQAYQKGGSVFGKKSLDEMQAELLSKEGLSRRALFGLKPDYPLVTKQEPLSKVEQEVQRAEQAARKKGEAPSVTASRVDVDPGTGRKKSIMESVTETPVSRRTVLKTAGSQVAQNMLPMGDLMKLAGAPAVTSPVGAIAQATQAARPTVPLVPLTAQGVIARAARMGLDEDETIALLEKMNVADEYDVLYMMPGMRNPYDFYEDFGSEQMSRARALANLINTDMNKPMQMRGPLREIKRENPDMYKELKEAAQDIYDYGQEF